MKQRNFSKIQNSVSAPRPVVAIGVDGARNDFAPSPDEVARKAYFIYLNEGSPEGHNVQHWLDAEAALNDERSLTRAHAFHDHT